MKVSNIKDIEKFFEVVDSCQGKVELVTGEGDRLPDDLIPRCSHCGMEMVPWWRSSRFWRLVRIGCWVVLMMTMQ